MDTARFDDFYFTICKETGGIEGLLHSLFSFFYRRTDFFYESTKKKLNQRFFLYILN